MNKPAVRSILRSLFWNSKEKRLRVPWRFIGMLSITGAILITLLLITGIFLSKSSFSLQLSSLSPEQIPFEIQFIGVLITVVSIISSVFLSTTLLDRRRFIDLGFHLDRDWWIDFCFGLLLGAGLMTVIFLVELFAGWIRISDIFVQPNSQDSFLASLLQSLVLFLCVGIYEETFVRGYLLLNLAEGLHLPPISINLAIVLSWLASSLVFGLFHVGNPHANLISTINLVLAGLFLGLGYILTGELAIPIGLHITWNFFQGNVFGFPVSGTTTGATLLSIQQLGHEILTGGNFGPEAGLVGVFAILLGSLLIFIWVRWRTGKANVQKHLAIYPKAASF